MNHFLYEVTEKNFLIMLFLNRCLTWNHKVQCKACETFTQKTTAFDILNKECGIMYYKGIQHGNNSAKTCHYIVLRQVHLPYVTLFKKWGTQPCIILWTILSLFPKEYNMVIIVQKQVITLSSDKFINSS